MERLTNKREADAQREEYKRRLANKYPKYPRNIQEEQFLRLASYEDTGLEPEEIKELLHDTTGPLHRKISEWIDAEAAGRLVVLPCKVGDGLWTFCNYPVEQVYSFTVTDISTLNGRTMLNTSRCGVIDARDVGKTVFLTRDEAEAAQKGGEG